MRQLDQAPEPLPQRHPENKGQRQHQRDGQPRRPRERTRSQHHKRDDPAEQQEKHNPFKEQRVRPVDDGWVALRWQRPTLAHTSTSKFQVTQARLKGCQCGHARIRTFLDVLTDLTVGGMCCIQGGKFSLEAHPFFGVVERWQGAWRRGGRWKGSARCFRHFGCVLRRNILLKGHDVRLGCCW